MNKQGFIPIRPQPQSELGKGARQKLANVVTPEKLEC